MEIAAVWAILADKRPGPAAWFSRGESLPTDIDFPQMVGRDRRVKTIEMVDRCSETWWTVSHMKENRLQGVLGGIGT